MGKQSIKKIVALIAVTIIVAIGFKILYFGSRETDIVNNVSTNSGENGQKIEDVVKTIVEMNYQPITSMVKENTEKGYVVIDMKIEGIKDNLHKILEEAKNLDIKITFINNEEVFNEDTSYYKIIEKDGHTVLPEYIEIENILKQNNAKIIKENKDFESLDNEDVAFIITEYNIKEHFVSCISNDIKELKNKGYHFKAFV